MKQYRLNHQIGSTKHSVSFHDGEKTHRDGSPFWDLKITRTKRDKLRFVKALAADGYTEK